MFPISLTVLKQIVKMYTVQSYNWKIFTKCLVLNALRILIGREDKSTKNKYIFPHLCPHQCKVKIQLVAKQNKAGVIYQILQIFTDCRTQTELILCNASVVLTLCTY